MSKSDYVVIDYHHAWIQKIFQGVGGDYGYLSLLGRYEAYIFLVIL